MRAFVTRLSGFLLALLFLEAAFVCAAPPEDGAARKLSTLELAEWIDRQFDKAWQEANVQPPAVVDDATFLKRTSLDLNGTIPTVSQAREFLGYDGEHKRATLIEQLLNETKRPQKHAERTAAHWATLWRRMMVPGNTPEAQRAVLFEPWLKEQFLTNVPYDEMARKIITVQQNTPGVTAKGPAMENVVSTPVIFFQTVGGKPETSASAVSRVFLGVRIGCAECHDHPFADWKQKDFWGVATYFSGIRNGAVGDSPLMKIRPENGPKEFEPALLWGTKAEVPKGKTSREAFADWMTSPKNPHFASTAVNRVWNVLIGRGLTDSVDDLDKAPPAERAILDELAQLFVASGYDVKWLITGICKSKLYQRECIAVDETSGDPLPGLRPLKTLLPEQVFNSLEQALALPVARADAGPRFNGLRDQLVARMNEAASNQPDEYRAGVPQALLLMNGRITTEATDLEQSRTLRGVLDAPFLNTEEKLKTLYLATLTRHPKAPEQQFLLEHIRKQPTPEKQQQAFQEIFWGLLNSPEFVLER